MHRALRTYFSLATLALTALTFTACRPKGEAASRPAPDPNTPVPVEVESHFQGDVTIYLVRGSLRQRLGMVTALGTGAFTFPWRWLGASGNNRLMVYPLAGAAAYFSDPLILQPGQWVRWTLMADLGRSNLVVYNGPEAP